MSMNTNAVHPDPPVPTLHVVEGYTVMIRGDVAYVTNGASHYAVNLPSAAVALVKTIVDPTQETK